MATSQNPPPVTVIYKTRPARLSCLHGLSISLISASIAFAVVFFVKNSYVYANSSYLDGIAERCSAGNGGKSGFLNQF